MQKNESEVKRNELRTIAPLTNVSLCSLAMRRAMERPQYLPGLVCLYGPAGYGKSMAAAYTANALDAYYIECKEVWGKKAVLLAILRSMGIFPARSVAEMMDQACEQLATSRKPLIIDEAGYLTKKKIAEVAQDIYEGSGAAILLIGEERLPQELECWERLHSRVLEWVPAQPVDEEDCKHLARLYCGNIVIADDLMSEVIKASSGSARRVAVNLSRIKEEAEASGKGEISLKDWGARSLYTGKVTMRRLA